MKKKEYNSQRTQEKHKSEIEKIRTGNFIKRKNDFDASSVVAILGLVVAFASLIVSCIAFNDSKNTSSIMNKFTKDMSHLNYSLKLEEKGGYLISDDETLFSANPFIFSYDRGKNSGDVKEIYFAYLAENNEANVIKVPSDKKLFYIDAGEILDKPLADTKDELENNQLSIRFASNKMRIEKPFMFHILLKSYNDEYQYFTILCYRENHNQFKINDIFTFDTAIIEDTDVYDLESIKKIFTSFKNNRYTTYQEFQKGISNERKRIKSILTE